MARQLANASRQKILREAIGIVYREGVDRITMRRLAEKLGYSPATIYLHFKNKEDLVTQIAVFGFDQLAENTRPALDIPDPIQALQEAGRRYIDFGLTHRELYRLMFQELRVTNPDRPDWQGAAQIWTSFLKIYQRAVDTGAFRPCDPARELALGWAMMHGFVQLADSERLPVQGLLDDSLQELREGLLQERTRALLA